MSPEVQCRIHKYSPIIPILNQFNPNPLHLLRYILILFFNLYLSVPVRLFPLGLSITIFKERLFLSIWLHVPII
jgi:hypothetical protein